MTRKNSEEDRPNKKQRVSGAKSPQKVKSGGIISTCFADLDSTHRLRRSPRRKGVEVHEDDEPKLFRHSVDSSADKLKNDAIDPILRLKLPLTICDLEETRICQRGIPNIKK